MSKSNDSTIAALGQQYRERFSLSTVGGLVFNTYQNTEAGKLVVWDGGTLAKLESFGIRGKRGKSGGGLRGPVGPFNKSMRRRMLRGIGTIRQDVDKPLFISGTYGRPGPSVDIAKVHLRAFLRLLIRQFPNASGVWRLGFQQDGTPHFHLIVWGVSYIGLAWISDAWLRSAPLSYVETLSPETLAAWRLRGIDITRARSGRSVGGYCGKYCAKSEPEAGPIWCGRRWGWFNVEKLPLAPRLVYRIKELGTFYSLRRSMRRIAHRRKLSGRRGITIFCGYPQQLVRLL